MHKTLFAAVMALTCSVQLSGATVYYDSHASGTGDGSSAANAYTDLAAAIAAAGEGGGEVRLVQGIHKPIATTKTTAITLPNVKLVGGWPAGGGERSTDPSLTILSGDLGDDDRYLDINNNEICKVVENGKIATFRDPTEEEGIWALDMAKVSDNAKQLFTVASGTTAADTQVLEGFSVVGFNGTKGSVYFNEAATACYPVITNCLFVANIANGSNGCGAIYLCNDGTVADCTFYGYFGTCISYGAGTSSRDGAVVKDCTFAYARMFGSNLSSCGLTAMNAKGLIRVINSDFKYLDFGFKCNTGRGFVMANQGGSYREIRDCRFEHLVATNFTFTTSGTYLNVAMISPMINAANGLTYMSGCTFATNLVRTTQAPHNGSIINVSYATNCTFIANRLINTSEVEYTAPGLNLLNAGKDAYNLTFKDNYVESVGKGYTYLLTPSSLRRFTAINNSIVNKGSGLSRLVSGTLYLGNCHIESNTVSTVDGESAMLSSGGTTDGTRCAEYDSVVNNKVVGGITNVLFYVTNVKFMNSIVAYNEQYSSRSNETGYVCTLVYHTSDAHVLWSTFYDNTAPCDFYGFNVSGNNARLHMHSSVCWRSNPTDDYSFRSGYLTPGSSKHVPGDLVVNVYDCCIRGLDLTRTDLYTTSCSNLYTDDPCVSPTLRALDDGRKYLCLMKKTPCRAKGKVPNRLFRAVAGNNNGGPGAIIVWMSNDWKVASSANLSATNKATEKVPADVPNDLYEHANDFLGEERTEGAVVLGAVQELEAQGLLMYIR